MIVSHQIENINKEILKKEPNRNYEVEKWTKQDEKFTIGI